MLTVNCLSICRCQLPLSLSELVSPVNCLSTGRCHLSTVSVQAGVNYQLSVQAGGRCQLSQYRQVSTINCQYRQVADVNCLSTGRCHLSTVSVLTGGTCQLFQYRQVADVNCLSKGRWRMPTVARNASFTRISLLYRV